MSTNQEQITEELSEAVERGLRSFKEATEAGSQERFEATVPDELENGSSLLFSSSGSSLALLG